MNNEKMTLPEWMLQTDERLDALERLAPSGSQSSGLLADTRSGADDKRPLESTSARTLPDLGGGELQRLLDHLEKEAAWWESSREFFTAEDKCPIINAYRKVAAVYRECAALLPALGTIKARGKREERSVSGNAPVLSHATPGRSEA